MLLWRRDLLHTGDPDREPGARTQCSDMAKGLAVRRMTASMRRASLARRACGSIAVLAMSIGSLLDIYTRASIGSAMLYAAASLAAATYGFLRSGRRPYVVAVGVWILVIVGASLVEQWSGLQRPTPRDPEIGPWALIFLIPAPLIAIGLGQIARRLYLLVRRAEGPPGSTDAKARPVS